ncbi:PKD domain-containing protein [Labilibaculum euxinus]|uniref:PKD domain-containing protein n=1 Tax=Labilibaculum euxinus TaxID=2686357 RepID=A0A7M4D806_9BACT|nr:PKD domain-containing protein [Labilibaculum euxinus]MUP38785.1 PKD domain-containing protein [Labilibaculum euxinus]MVB07990.1 PKD domain-containing protein [Labilibaculum euxinus]
MKSIFTILLAIAISFPILAQNKKLTAQKHSTLGVKNIVITEKTYNDLTNPTLNKRKLAKIADKEAGKPKRADDPIARALYERNLLKNPLTGQIPLNIKELEKAYVLSSASGLQSRLKTGGLSYINSGPRNVGGRTRALAIDINDATGNTILAGGTTGGMWKSTDNGVSWIRTTKLEDHPSVTSIAQDPNNTAIWYYTTGELIGNSASVGSAPYRGNGLFKSTDNGDSWTSLTSTASNTSEIYDAFDYAWNICIDPINSDVYVATSDGIKRSTDGGTSWTDVIESDSYYEDIICTPSGIKYASLSADGTTKGIYRSVTGNLNEWEDITPSGFPADYNRVVLAHAPSNTTNDIVYILGETIGAGFQDHSFWKLTYNAAATTPATWVDRSQNLPEGGDGDTDVNGYNSQGSYNMVIKVAPDNENMVFIGGTNLLRSDDAFATKASPLSVGKSTDESKTYWIGGYATENNISQYPNHHPDVHALVFKNDNATLLCGHDGGISITNNYKQTDDTFSETAGDKSMPVDWEFLNNGYLTTQAYTVAVDNDIRTNKVLLSGFQDNGTWLAETSDPDKDWLAWGSGDGSYCSIFNLGTSIYSSSQSGTTYLENNVTDEASYYWTRVDPEGATGQLFINPFVEDANNSEILYYAAGQYIWRNSNIFEIPKLQSNEANINWEKLEISKASGTVSAMESSTFPAHILYYGTSTGKVYKIENSHSKWAKKNDITGTNMPAGNVISIDANPLNANEVLVGFSNYGIESIFSTTDGGTTWTPVSGNLEEINGENNGPSIRSVAYMVSPTDTIYYAGTSTGLYSTTKLEGSSTIWTQQAINQIGTSVVSMIKARRDGFFAVATHGNGVFTADDDFSSAAPVALIGMTKDSIQIGEAVDFMNRSIGDGFTKWEWTFEGAETTTSADEHPRGITYNTSGVYKVSLTATNAAGETTQEISSAIIVKSVKSNFIANTTNVNVGTQVSFTNQSTGSDLNYNWSFPGGTPDNSTEQNPVITYNTVGTFDVTLTISDNEYNDTETKVGYITVLDPDDFDDTLLYNISAEDESKLSIYSLTWGYTSGHNNYNMSQFAEKFEMVNPNLNVVRSIQLNPVFVEAQSSDPKIAIKIWNGESVPETEIYSKEIAFSELQARQFNEIILDSPIEVNSSFFVGYEVFYENPVDTFAVWHLPLDGDITWDNSAYLTYEGEWKSFSDGSIYAANSALAIKALVGYEKNIAPPLKADFTVNSTTTTTADNISFTDLSTGAIASWEWNFAGGTADDNTLQNPTVSYSEAGIYDVTLTVNGTNGTSNTNTKENYITVEMATAINELGEEVEKLMIYPNPLVYKSNVVFPNKTNQKYRLVVVDASGRVVRIIENITGNNVIINREQLKPGVHIINLSGEKIYKGKLLVK